MQHSEATSSAGLMETTCSNPRELLWAHQIRRENQHVVKNIAIQEDRTQERLDAFERSVESSLAAMQKELDSHREMTRKLQEQRKKDFVREKELLKRVYDLESAAAGSVDCTSGSHTQSAGHEERFQMLEESVSRLEQGLLHDMGELKPSLLQAHQHTSELTQNLMQVRHDIGELNRRSEIVEKIYQLQPEALTSSVVMTDDTTVLSKGMSQQTGEQGAAQQYGAMRKLPRESSLSAQWAELSVTEEGYRSHEERVALSRKRRQQRKARKAQAAAAAAAAGAQPQRMA